MRRIAVVIALFASSGCTYHQLSTRGSQIETLPTAPGSECQNLGPVIGKGGGGFGEFVSNESLMDYAIADARNKAAEMGATSVVLSAPQLGNAGSQYGSTTTSATVMGIAYRCPNRAPLSEAPPGATPAASEWTTTAAGFRGAIVRVRTAARTGPDALAPGKAWLEPGTRVSASESEVHGFRRVRLEDGATWYVETGALELDP